jgi:hypothetical protein
VAVARLFVKSTRQANKNEVALKDRPVNFVLPVLPGLEILHVQPGIDSIPYQALVKFADHLLIPVCINKENVHLLC